MYKSQKLLQAARLMRWEVGLLGLQPIQAGILPSVPSELTSSGQPSDLSIPRRRKTAMYNQDLRISCLVDLSVSYGACEFGMAYILKLCLCKQFHRLSS